jgi:carbon monoxide dehydrogenase subunit G
VRLAGRRTIRAPRETIWAFLLTPARLRHCLPGCERFEASGPDEYAATLRLGVAFLKGTYQGTVRVAEQRFPEYLVLHVAGSGALGSLTASGALTFTEDERRPGTTELHYQGEATVGGRITAVGERVINATAERLIGLFFDCLASQVESGHT